MSLGSGRQHLRPAACRAPAASDRRQPYGRRSTSVIALRLRLNKIVALFCTGPRKCCCGATSASSQMVMMRLPKAAAAIGSRLPTEQLEATHTTEVTAATAAHAASARVHQPCRVQRRARERWWQSPLLAVAPPSAPGDRGFGQANRLRVRRK